MKIALVGHPGSTIQLGDRVITVMTGGTVPRPSDALPAPPTTPTEYVVSIASEQWNGVVPGLSEPGAALLVRGMAYHETEAPYLLVLAHTVTLTNDITAS